MTESRITEGLASWPAVAAEARLPADGWTPELLNSRRDAEANRVVLRLTRPGMAAVVLKQGFGPAGIRSVGAAVGAQRRAQAQLGSTGAFRVPEVLAAPEGSGAVLMQAAGGMRLADLVDTDGLMPALVLAGGWLDAFHRCGPVEERAFQPKFMLNHLSKLSAEAIAGKRPIARADVFARTVAQLDTISADSRDAPTVSSLRHGDLNARNLLVDTSGSRPVVWGIDFSEAGQGPVGYDIARLLVHLVELSVRQPAAKLVPGPMMAAFFEGYLLTRRRDRSLGFLILARLLSDWASLPGDEDGMSLFKAIRLERILQLAAAATGPA